MGPADFSGKWFYEGELGGFDSTWILHLRHDSALGEVSGTSRFELVSGRQVAELADPRLDGRTLIFTVPESTAGSRTFFKKEVRGTLSRDGQRIEATVLVNEQTVYVTFARALPAQALAAEWVLTGGTSFDERASVWGSGPSRLIVRAAQAMQVRDGATGALAFEVTASALYGSGAAPVERLSWADLGAAGAAFYGIAGDPQSVYSTLEARVQTGSDEGTVPLASTTSGNSGGRGFFGTIAPDGTITALFDAAVTHASLYEVTEVFSREGQGDLVVVDGSQVSYLNPSTGAATRWSFDPSRSGFGRDAQVGPGGELYLSGEVSGATTLGSSGSAVTVQSDFVARYSAEGALEWVVTTPWVGASEPVELTVTPAGLHGVVLRPDGFWELFLLEPNGALVWRVPLAMNSKPELTATADALVVSHAPVSGIYQSAAALYDVVTTVLRVAAESGAVRDVVSLPAVVDVAAAGSDLYAAGWFEEPLLVWDGSAVRPYGSVGGEDWVIGRFAWPQ